MRVRFGAILRYARLHEFRSQFYVRKSGPATACLFPGRYAPGTIVISTAERRLYLVLPNGQALRYGIGVGRDGFRWGGVHRITAKKEWPSWTPPSQMIARRPDLPRHMKGGIENPLGARAMYLGSTLYRIHGSNEPETIGQAVSSGCFRMTNEDVMDLYNRVPVGTTVSSSGRHVTRDATPNKTSERETAFVPARGLRGAWS